MSPIIETRVIYRRGLDRYGNIVIGFNPDILNYLGLIESSERYNGTLAELLLNKPATAVLHLGKVTLASQGGKRLEPVLLGVNYHEGHSEGEYKIIVQDIVSRRGPWVLYRPPKSDHKTFYLQDIVFPGLYSAEFNPQVANPAKIRYYYYHLGNPMEIFEDFKNLGFEFIDHPMPVDHYEDLIQASHVVTI